MATEPTEQGFIADPVMHEALANATVDPDGLPFYRCKFYAGEFIGLTQIEKLHRRSGHA